MQSMLMNMQIAYRVPEYRLRSAMPQLTLYLTQACWANLYGEGLFQQPLDIMQMIHWKWMDFEMPLYLIIW